MFWLPEPSLGVDDTKGMYEVHFHKSKMRYFTQNRFGYIGYIRKYFTESTYRFKRTESKFMIFFQKKGMQTLYTFFYKKPL